MIVINDGSKDSTMQQLQEAFDLVEAPRALRGPSRTRRSAAPTARRATTSC